LAFSEGCICVLIHSLLNIICPKNSSCKGLTVHFVHICYLC
jgi:hypothetical protein